MTLVRERDNTLKLIPAPVHEHYCAECDRRWPCYDARCLLYEFTPCRDRGHME